MDMRQSGLTLVEMLAGMAVAGILVAVAVPSFDRMIKINRLKGAATEVYGDLQYARYEAIQRNRCVAVTFNAAAASYQVATVTGGTGCPAAGTSVLLKSTQLEDVTMEVSGSGAITFEPRQGAVQAAGAITLAGIDNRRLQNQVNVLGRIRLCSPEGSLAGYASC